MYFDATNALQNGTNELGVNGSNSYTNYAASILELTKETASEANFTANITSGNAPLAVKFTDTSTGTTTNWTWDFGDGGTSTEQTPTHVYTTEGTYTVKLTVSNSLGSDSEEKIGYITGFGTTVELKSYSFIDNKIATGAYSYRLKQIDFDGTFSYSSVIEIEVSGPKDFVLEQNYPNPFNPTTKIRYQIPEESKVVIKIYDILGAEVMTLLNDLQEAGTYEVELNAQNLSSGTYFYRIVAGEFVETKKMILLR
jgi:PKD repeat protein